jgi:hypothetical protein
METESARAYRKEYIDELEMTGDLSQVRLVEEFRFLGAYT